MNAARTGFFLTFEGGEGAGKSTQAARLVAALRARGLGVVQTREPGGSEGAEQIRALLVTGDAARWTPLTEALLMNAARADHLERTIRPALARGDVVVCDRFADSTDAYQGAGGGAPPEWLDQLRAMVVGGDDPDLTIILETSVEEGLRRAALRGGDDRFEGKGEAYHRRLAEAYRAIARRFPERCVLIDASRTPDEVFADVLDLVEARLAAPKTAR